LPKLSTSAAGKLAGMSGVQTGLGAKALTRIFLSASLLANERVRLPMTARIRSKLEVQT